MCSINVLFKCVLFCKIIFNYIHTMIYHIIILFTYSKTYTIYTILPNKKQEIIKYLLFENKIFTEVSLHPKKAKIAKKKQKKQISSASLPWSVYQSITTSSTLITVNETISKTSFATSIYSLDFLTAVNKLQHLCKYSGHYFIGFPKPQLMGQTSVRCPVR